MFQKKIKTVFFFPKSGHAFLKRNSVFSCFFHKKHENFFENLFIATETVTTFWKKTTVLIFSWKHTKKNLVFWNFDLHHFLKQKKTKVCVLSTFLIRFFLDKTNYIKFSGISLIKKNSKINKKTSKKPSASENRLIIASTIF